MKNHFDYSKAMRKASREAQVQALREGRKNRAVVFVNRKKEANKKACRKKFTI
tara:strand:- start:447 stop:605 length:159 start_codon:yes stop_codon:yes gene_type:complete